MKLIRIGSSQVCDVQMASSYVSSSHAEMTLLDTGEIILEDLGSTNGTFVNGTKIKPNQEVAVRRGDRIRFADTELVWSRIPSLPSNATYTQIVNIGTNYRNDIQVNSGTVSRFHAVLKIDKKGRAFIIDNGSRNGTKVNGIKAQKDTPVQIKKGDNVILGNEDVTDNLQQYIPSPSNWLKILSLTLGSVAAVAAIVFVALKFISTEPTEKAVAHVLAEYHYEITLNDTPVEFEGLKFRYPKTGELTYQGTAFFIDQLGHLATNRHISHPWEYRKASEDDQVKKYVESSIEELFGGLEVSTEEQFVRFASSPIGELICAYIVDQYPKSQRLIQLNVLINRIRKSSLNIKGIHNRIAIGFSGQMYDDYSDYSPCTVVADSKQKEIDVAIIRLNTMKTPEDVGTVFDINKAYISKLTPMEDDLRIMGFPNGLGKAFATTITLEPTTIETKCSKTPGKYDFECQAASAGGASGSPVFYANTNELVGVLSGGYMTNDGGTICVQARYLKELYDKECK